MSQILHNLYLSDIETVRFIENNEASNFVVLSCAIESDTKFDYKIDLYDGKNKDMKIMFDDAADFIKTNMDNDKKILVHCIAGASRSAGEKLIFLDTMYQEMLLFVKFMF